MCYVFEVFCAKINVHSTHVWFDEINNILSSTFWCATEMQIIFKQYWHSVTEIRFKASPKFLCHSSPGSK